MKIVFFVGDQAVGKTLILNKLVNKVKNSSKYKPTVGQHHQLWEHEVQKGKFVTFQLWDTAGQEKYRAITKKSHQERGATLTISHYKKGVGAVIVYDITKEDSFCNVKNWLQEINENCTEAESEMPSILVIGNKRDLQNQRKISYEEAKSILKREDKDIGQIDFTEVTVFDPIDNDHIENIFNQFFKKIYDKLKKKNLIQETDGTQRLNERNVQSSKCCC